MHFGLIMQKCRERAGLSQDVVAKMMDRSRSCISKFEKDHKVMDMFTMRRWAEVTNSQDVIFAFVQGVDLTTIAQQVLQMTGMG